MSIAYRACKARHPVFDATGAAQAGGRWNSPGSPVIYCSESLAGSLLEILVHANAPAQLPGPHHCARAFLPLEVQVEVFDETAHPAWNQEPDAARSYGDAWLAENRTAVLAVPAATARPYGRHLLLNPAHPDFVKIARDAPVEVPWDERLFPDAER